MSALQAAAAVEAGRPVLTDRQRSILEQLADGRSTQWIRREHQVSIHTVHDEVRRIRRALGAVDRAHAVAIGFRTGLLVRGDDFLPGEGGAP